MDADKLIDVLTKAGYRPERDGYSNVVFKHEGGSYLLMVDEADGKYLRVVYPNFWTFKEVERTTMVLAAQQSTSDIKAAKIHLIDLEVWAAVEYFATDEVAALAVLDECLMCLQAITRDFIKRIS